MKTKLSILLLTIVVVWITACHKQQIIKTVDPKTPQDSLNIKTPATKAGVANLLLNAYSLLDGEYSTADEVAPWATGTDNWAYGSVAGGEAHKGSNPTDQIDIGQIETYTPTPKNTVLGPKWYVNITGIHYANAAIVQVPLVKDGSLTAAEGVEVVAEARFLRGFYEMELAKLWRNVPYIDETVEYNKGYNDVANGPVWDKIEADFSAAVAVLPGTQPQSGRPNKYAAEAFLAKAYLFDHKYAQAKPLLNDLISNGVTSKGMKYSLVHYADNFNPSTKNGAEGVFVIQATVHDGSGGTNGNAGDILNFPSGGPTLCCGFFQPSFSFVNAFKTDGATGLPLLDSYNSSDLKNDEGVRANDVFIPTGDPVDPRLDWSVGRRGIPYLDWGIMPGAPWISGGGESPFVNIKSVYYQAAQASTSEDYQGWATHQATSNSYNAIRFADVLLWAAEVEVEVGSLQKAEDYVNIVRTRAADPTGWVHSYQNAAQPTAGYTNIPAANYKIGLYGSAGTGGASYSFAANGQAYARKAIYMERMLELGMEGHRFFDLQRWDGTYGGPAGAGFMAGVLNAYAGHEANLLKKFYPAFDNVTFKAGTNELYPIPQTQLDASKGKMKQTRAIDMRYKKLLLFLLLAPTSFAFAQKMEFSGNPIVKGWYADPEAKIFGKEYWVYPTYSAPYNEQVFMDAFSSPDLVHWTKHSRIVDSSSVKWVKRALWAPAVTKKDGKYYLFFGANDIHDDTKEIGGIGVAVSDNPGGPFKDYLGKPLIGKIYNKAQPIDQFVYKDTDGQYYIIYGGWGQCNIAKLNNDFTGFIPFKDGETFKCITPQDYVEGPVMFKRNSKYYLMWSEGGWTGPDYRVAYAIGDTPFGPFKRIATVLKQDEKIATGAGHHSVINIPGTNEWYIVYHRRPLGETDGNHRVTCIDKMYFDGNGMIEPIKITNEGVKARKL